MGFLLEGLVNRDKLQELTTAATLAHGVLVENVGVAASQPVWVVAVPSLVIPADVFPILWLWLMAGGAVYLDKMTQLDRDTGCMELLRSLNSHNIMLCGDLKGSDVALVSLRHLKKTFDKDTMETRYALLANAMCMLEDLKNTHQINRETNTQ
jgi:hypothetical protein